MDWGNKKRLIKSFIPSLTIQANPQIDRTLSLLPPNAKICDIGAGGRKITKDTFTIDAFVTENTDLICDAHNIPLPDETFDCIFCTGTLEHVANPTKVLGEIHRLLKRNAIVHIEVPFIQGYHPDPNDYWRWTLQGIKLLCAEQGFEEIQSGVHIGPSSPVTWVLNYYLDCFSNNIMVRRLLNILSRFILFPIKYLDYLLVKKENVANIASGVYFIGRKSDERFLNYLQFHKS